MAERIGSPNDDRVAYLYQRITGKPMRQGSWSVEDRDFAMKIAYIEQACRSVLSTIADLEKASDRSEIQSALRSLRSDFKFINTLKER